MKAAAYSATIVLYGVTPRLFQAQPSSIILALKHRYGARRAGAADICHEVFA